MRMHWVVLADEAKARILSGGALLDDLIQVQELDHAEGRMRDEELNSDRPGRFSTSSARRTGADPRTEREEVESMRFARELAALLLRGLNDRTFERLILVAPPRFLGRLRANLDPNVARRVIAEIDKDLTRMPIDDLPAALMRAISPTAGMP